ncbi:MAG: hypothetical protein ACRD3G_18030 [Vicinamibacterales bacterium]
MARALTTTGTERLNAIRDALAFRGHRRSLFPASAESERAAELREGLAEYTGNVVASATPADARAFAVRLLTNPDGDGVVRRWLSIPSGRGIRSAPRRGSAGTDAPNYAD